MSSMAIEQYREEDALEWDEFCSSSHNATLLHTRRFLSYHGDRFKDKSLLIRDEKNELVGIFPAAISPDDSKLVVSHPGISYGGLVHQSNLYGERVLSALSDVCDFYSNQGFDRLLYKAVPRLYQIIPAEDDLYSLFRLNARLVRRDLSATLDLSHRGKISQRRIRGRKKALKEGVQIEEGCSHMPEYWGLLTEVLSSRHGVNPVHSLSEIECLSERFPESIKLMVAVFEQEIVAGVLLFLTPIAMHAQYIAASPTGYSINALDYLFEHAIGAAKDMGLRYFDFGISNEQSGKILNQGLYQFKHEYGAGGCVHDFYEVLLNKETV